ncbi:DUF2478 domain-containing protein [Ruegeria sediminis]|nr:DUF2478 domain-containing protein [Ruegeria sediminis]
MKIGVVSAEGRGETDRLLAEVADAMQAEGIRTAGIVKVLEHVSAFENGCDMKVRVLPDGPVIKITQSLGQGSGSCRLDPSAIAESVAQVENGTLDDAHLLILNKFGPEEINGRGFRGVIGKALDLGIPVLVGIGSASRAEFDTFSGGLAETLPGETEAIRDWCMGAVRHRTEG